MNGGPRVGLTGLSVAGIVSVQHDHLTIDNLVHYYPHTYFKRIIDGVSAVQTKPYRSLAGKRLIAKGLLP
ncbi:hypothetical protein C8R30_1301, partial [Nitrosomonas nitrosa]